MSRIRDDLQMRIYERLHKWIEDSADLYHMGDLSDKAAVEDIIAALVRALATGVVQYDVSEAAIVNMLKMAIKITAVKVAERGAEPK